MFKKINVCILFLFINLLAQETVEVKGVGPDRNSAIQNGLREAVAQALGTKVISETEVQNFKLIKDVIQARTQGYVSSYEIIEETPFPDKYEVKIRARVSLSPLEMDAKSLAQWLGGLRFMVVYDPRKLKTSEDTILYNYAYERMNEYLARNGYRYVEKDVFDRLKNEAIKLIGADTSSIGYAMKLAFLADAEFFINISNIVIREENKAMGIKAIKATTDAKSYDNCTAEGLGSVVGEGDWQIGTDKLEAQRKAIDGAIYNAGEKIINLILKYLGEWCNNGAPFELRFYGIKYKNARKLKDKILSDPDFGGQREIVSAGDYIKMSGITFKKTPDELVDKILDYAESVGLSNLDLKLLYGRQASFAPEEVSIPEAQQKERIGGTIRRK